MSLLAGAAGAGQGDSEGVDGSFDDDRRGAAGQAVGVLGEAVELVALGEQDGLAGVEVLRSGLDRAVGARLEPVVLGVAPADEPDDLRLRGA